MSFFIPKPYLWNESFKTYYEQIDNEHMGLFMTIYNVARMPDSPDRLHGLREAMHNHFANEQAIMAARGYPRIHIHTAIHDEFLAKLDSLSTPVSVADCQYCMDWLVNHIKVHDFKYKGKLGSH